MALMMETLCNTETSANIYHTTWRDISEEPSSTPLVVLGIVNILSWQHRQKTTDITLIMAVLP